jgi:Nucleotidyl transferase AbiEii toxin, Type IV TA system
MAYYHLKYWCWIILELFCEKIMSLVHFSYTEKAIDDLHKKIRHVYDLHQLLLDKEIEAFFESDAFDEMLLKVANDDVASFKNNNSWLQYPPQSAIIFARLTLYGVI